MIGFLFNFFFPSSESYESVTPSNEPKVEVRRVKTPQEFTFSQQDIEEMTTHGKEATEEEINKGRRNVSPTLWSVKGSDGRKKRVQYIRQPIKEYVTKHLVGLYFKGTYDDELEVKLEIPKKIKRKLKA